MVQLDSSREQEVCQVKRETIERLVRSLKEELRNEEAKLDILKDLHRRSVNQAKEEALKSHTSTVAHNFSNHKFQTMNGDAAPIALTVNRSSSSSNGAPYPRHPATASYGHPAPAHAHGGSSHRRSMPNVPANLSVTKAPAAHAASSPHGHGTFHHPPQNMPPGLYHKTASATPLGPPKVRL